MNRPIRKFQLAKSIILAVLAVGMLLAARQLVAPPTPAQPRAAKPQAPLTIADKIVAGARAQLGTVYRPGYVGMRYPNGDLPAGQGVCTDVVVRALRCAGFDLQKLIHEDMKVRFDEYPRRWGLTRPDPNIDHRRVPNQMCFLKRHALSLTLEVSPQTLEEWRGGDLVYWKLDNGLDHCGVVSDTRTEGGVPLVIHNLTGCEEEDCLRAWEIIGHFRYPK